MNNLTTTIRKCQQNLKQLRNSNNFELVTNRKSRRRLSYITNRLPLSVWMAKNNIPLDNKTSQIVGLSELEYVFKHVFTNTTYRILDYLVYLQSRGIPLYMSQSRIADVIGVCRQTVNEHISNLKHLGFLAVYNRKFKTCIYKLTTLFKEAHLREIFACYLPALKEFINNPSLAYKYVSKSLPSTFFYSIHGRSFSVNPTLYTKGINIYNKQQQLEELKQQELKKKTMITNATKLYRDLDGNLIDEATYNLQNQLNLLFKF